MNRDNVPRRSLAYLLVFTLVLGIFFGYGWGAPDTARADESPTQPDATGAYLIAPSFDSRNVSRDGSKTIKLTGNNSTIIEPNGDEPGYIRLIPPQVTNPYSFGSAFLSRRIYSETGFSSMFDIYMGAGTDKTADGWAFIIAADTNGVQKGSGTFGYENIAGSDFTKSVAIKFDTYVNKSGEKVPFIGYGEKGEGFDVDGFSNIPPGTDGDGVTTRYMGIMDPAFTTSVKDIHCYCWVDYESKNKLLKFYASSRPVKPDTPAISRSSDIESIIGNEYYIGFSAASGGLAQEYDLKQFYVLNNYKPDSLKFNADGKGLSPDIPIVEDFTPPTSPIVSQSDLTHFTFGSSSDDSGVEKYQYSYSVKGDKRTDAGNDWTGWIDYKDNGKYVLDASVLVGIEGLISNSSKVEARAIDSYGNISASASYTYDASAWPSLSLSSPVNAPGSDKVRYADAQSITLDFSQAMSLTSPGSIALTETGGDGTVALADGPLTANDARWKGTRNRLTLPLAGVEPGARYTVSGAGFRGSAGLLQRELATPFTYTVMAREQQPGVSIDYVSEDLVFTEGASETFSVNGTSCVADASGRLPLKNIGYDGSARNVTIIRPGKSVTGSYTDDSLPASLTNIPARPQAPDGLYSANVDSKSRLYYKPQAGGSLTDLQYTAAAPSAGSRTWTACSVSETDASGSYMTLPDGSNGNIYVRKAAKAGDSGNFVGGETSVRIADKSVSVSLEAPDLGGRMGYGAEDRQDTIHISATGNTHANVDPSQITITQEASAPFILTKPQTSFIVTPGQVAPSSLTVRTSDGIGVGVHNATVNVPYTFDDGSQVVSFTAQTEISLVVTEATPHPVIDYVGERITGLDGGATYVIGDSRQISTPHGNGSIPIEDDWYGSGILDDKPKLQIRRYNKNTNLNSEASELVIPSRPARPSPHVEQETFKGFGNSMVNGITTAMSISGYSGSTWTDLATSNLDGKFDKTAGTIKGLDNGSYSLRINATSTSFKSLPQNIEIKPSAKDASYELTLGIAQGSVYSLEGQKYLYSDDDVATHHVEVRNTGNQTLTSVRASLSGASPSAFTLNGGTITSLAPAPAPAVDTSSISVNPAPGLAVGTYTATLTVSADYSSPLGSGTVKRSYGLSFVVEKAKITAFDSLTDWHPGMENTQAILENLPSADAVRTALINGMNVSGVAKIDGYKKVTAILDSGGRAEIPITSWGGGDQWNPGKEGTYTFIGTMDMGGLAANIDQNAHVPDVDVILGDLRHGFVLDKTGTFNFPSAQYGYSVGDSGVHPMGVTITSIGSESTGVMTAELSGPDAACFELIAGSKHGQTADLDSITQEHGVNTALSVRPIPGLTPEATSLKTYNATVTVRGEGSESRSFGVSFTVDLARITAFKSIELGGGREGAPTLGMTEADVIASLAALYPSVTAVCAGGGTLSFPVSVWSPDVSSPSYNPSVAGTYMFKGTLGAVPPYFTVASGDISPTISVTIVPTVNAQEPAIAAHPQGGARYTQKADPGNALTLGVAASVNDDGTLSYQWYSNTVASNAGGTPISGATDSTYTVPRTATGFYHYYCVVTNTNNAVNGDKQTVAASDAATVNILRRPQSPLVILDPHAIYARVSPFIYQLALSGGDGSGEVTFSKLSGDDSIATVSTSGALTVKSPGAVRVHARKAGDADWEDSAYSNTVIIDIQHQPYDIEQRPTRSAIYGQTLADVPLTDITTSPAGLWSWEEPPGTQVGPPDDDGIQPHPATFTPDSGSYKVLTNMAINIYVSKKPVTVSGITFADKSYDGTTTAGISQAPVIDGIINGDSVGLEADGVSWAFAAASDAASVEVAGDNGIVMPVIRTGDYAIVGSHARNYTLAQPVGSFSARIKPGFAADDGVHYTTSLNGHGVTSGALTVTARDGYGVAVPIASGGSFTDPGHNDPWAQSVEITSAAVTDGSASFYVRRTGSSADDGIAPNEISKKESITYTIDKTPPIAEVAYRDNLFRQFLNTITLGRFFKDTLDIAIKADDPTGAGIEHTYYYIDRSPGSAPLTEDELESHGWLTYNDISKPHISDSAKIALYVKPVDKAGNWQIYKDGIVIYKDAEPEANRYIHYVKATKADQTTDVTRNGNEVLDVKYGSQILTPGAVVWVAGSSITFAGEYLDTFVASDEPYTFTVTYRPFGVTYSAVEGNEAPSTTAIKLYVSKHEQSAPSVTIGGVSPPAMSGGQSTDGIISTSYGIPPFILAATASGGSADYVWTVSPAAASPITIGALSGYEGGSAVAVAVTLTGIGRSEITVYRPGDDSYSASPSRRITVNAYDSASPTPGGSENPPDPTVTHGAFTSNGAVANADMRWSTDIRWKAAEDDITREANIEYYLYHSDSPSNNITNPGDCEKNGTLLTSGSALTSHSAIALTSGAIHWFNVVAKDASDNKSAYNAVRVITPLCVSFSAIREGGIDGIEASSGIRVTFDKDVTGFSSEPVSIGANAYETAAVDDAGDSDLKTWSIPITVTGANRSTTIVTLAAWTDRSNYHSYIPRPAAVSGIELFAPDPWPTPSAVIDYDAETIRNLSPGGIYQFNYNGGSYEGERTINPEGSYPIPFDKFGYRLGIIKVKSVDDAKEKSPAQFIDIPNRPDMPSIDVTQPGANTGPTSRGAVTITNYNSALDYQYRKMSEVTWTEAGENTITGLEGGRYYIRVKPSDSSFASNLVPFYIRAFDEVRFEPALEGYAQPTPRVVTIDAGLTISAVTLTGGGYTSFEHRTSGSAHLLQPQVGLRRGTHKTTAHITYEDTDGSSKTLDENVIFTVYPKVEFMSGVTPGALATDEDNDGLTDTLTLNFKYPVDLRPYGGSLFIGDAAEKKKEQTGFTYVNEDLTVYKLKITPLVTAVTGKSITVRVRMGQLANSGDYAFQTASQGGEGSVYNYDASVSIPRGIKEVKLIDSLPGWDSALLQFTLMKGEGFYGIKADDLTWTPSPAAAVYDGPITLGGDAKVNIRGVYRIDLDYDQSTGVGYTYRLHIDVVSAGALTVAIPSYGAIATHAGIVIKGDRKASGFIYFLDDSGRNYPTDRNARQMFGSLNIDGVEYSAPALSLRTSAGLDNSTISAVYLDERELDPSAYSVKVAEKDTHLIFDGYDYGLVTNQAIVYLNEGWTRQDGDHVIGALFETTDTTTPSYIAATCVVNVDGITSTYPLTMLEGEGGTGAVAKSSDGIPANTYTTHGAFEAGADVKIEARPAEGFKFGRWSQVSEPGIELPETSIGSITMPAEAVTIEAIYTDGTPPVTSVIPTSGSWIPAPGLVRLEAYDVDPTTASAVGGIAEINYIVDGVAHKVQSSGAAINLTTEGVHSIEYSAVDKAGNREATRSAVMYLDETVPTVSIQFNGAAPATFDPSPQVVHFYTKDKMAGDIKFTVNAGDQGSDQIKETKYLVTTSSIETPSDAIHAAGWQVYTGPFLVTTKGAYYVYAQAVDGAGNVTVVNTQGIAIYENSERDTSSITFEKLSGHDVAANVRLNGNSIAGISNGALSLTPGVDYITGEDTVTFGAAYLQTLPVGSHELSISYKPQGYPYVQTYGNQPPDTTALTVNVRTAPLSFSLVADPTSGAVYGEGNVMLKAVANIDDEATGKVIFYNGATSIGAATMEDSIASVRVTLDAGTHSAISAEYEGDDNYGPGTATMAAYFVGKADRQAPTISEGSITVEYGTAGLILHALGGNGDRHEWTSADTSVVTVGGDGAEGVAQIVGIGTAQIQVKILASDNYNESAYSDPITITAGQRSVQIMGVMATDKVYDGDKAATPITESASIYGRRQDDAVTFVVGTAAFDSATAGADKTVTFAGFALAGADSAKYTLASQPAATTADILRATPSAVVGAPTATGIYFGQRVSDSTLSGAVIGVTGAALDGTWAWLQGAGELIPGEDDTSLSATGYDYVAAFTPADTANYIVLTTPTSIHVSRAAVRLAGDQTAAYGSPIFITHAGVTQDNTLADVTISSIVVSTHGGSEVNVQGSWAWDVSDPGSHAYTVTGSTTETATFTPHDQRLETKAFDVDFYVVDARPYIEVTPIISPAAYGSRVGNVGISEAGAMVYVDKISGSAVVAGVPIAGEWSWRNGEDFITSKAKVNDEVTHQSTLVFKPESPYVTVEAIVNIPVEKVSISGHVPGNAPAVQFGQALSASAIGSPSGIYEPNSGFRFVGTDESGDANIAGTLSWKNDTIIPETAPSPGAVYVAVFIPTGEWANVYNAPYELTIPVKVLAEPSVDSALNKILYGNGISLSAIQILDYVSADIAIGNYTPSAIMALRNAVDSLNSSKEDIDQGTISQYDAQRLLEQVNSAINGLVHDHPVLDDSRPGGITGTGQDIRIEIRGQYESVDEVT
ncbi:MAG: YDG domain-containing protein, partial [Clostridiales Family XIII bacterium]|nr:YDG domain-containing protein [Clostridiales Family XIII bacterium]